MFVTEAVETLNAELPVDLLDQCASEPIQVPGAIQPHGHLVAFDASGVVKYISEQFPAPSGPASAALGVHVASLLGYAAFDLIQRSSRVQDGGPDDDEDGLVLELDGRAFDSYVHEQDDLTLVEFEPLLAVDRSDARLLARTLKRLQRATDLPSLFEVAVREIRRFSGYDRVVVYHFNETGDGDVLAESRDSDIASYLGLRFPASDIPAQARELYRKNWMRSIPDVDYVPVPVLSKAGDPSLDMSFSTLRSISPVHRQYMREMGLRASMSISLIRDGQLWGLLSCGHRTPRLLSREIRTACLSIGRLLSLQLSALETLRDSALLVSGQERLAPLVDSMRASPGGVLRALMASPDQLLGVVAGTGVAVVIDDAVVVFGVCPGATEVLELARWAREQSFDSDLLATSNLSTLFSPALAYKEIASGLLWVSLPKPVLNAVLWFRPEIARTVTWAGEPHKAVETVGTGSRMGPRHSFEAWKATVLGMSEPWSRSELSVARDMRRTATELDLTNQVSRALKAIASRDELMAVVSHDLRSPMTVVSLQASMMVRALTNDETPASKRLRAAAHSIHRSAARMSALLHDLQDTAAIEQGRFQIDLQTQDVSALFDDANALLLPLADARGITLSFDTEPGLTVCADPERFYQVLSNLVGNALKFTLSEGAVRVAAHAIGDDDRWLRVTVSDTGSGMSEDTLSHVFERYWLIKDSKLNPVGSGLGLYIARGLVEAHGGELWATSTTGVGSIFAFTMRRPDPRS